MFYNDTIDAGMAQMGDAISGISFVIIVACLSLIFAMIFSDRLRGFFPQAATALLGGLIAMSTVGISDSLAGNIRSVASAAIDFLTSGGF